jgi:hypothetical protein
MPNCLAGCVPEYLCGSLVLPGPAGEQAESFAPWVWVRLGEKGKEITVGNKSFPGNPNTACIKSYEIGWVDTPQVTVEIIDEDGGRMGAIVDSIKKCMPAFGNGTEIISQFGWIIATCEGGKRKIESLKFKHQVTHLEMSYSEGKIRYKIVATANTPVFEDMREDNTKGEDDKKINIEQAIENLCSLPPATRVRYVQRQKDGSLKDVKFKWKKFGEGGPKSTWQGDNQNRIASITKWMECFRIDDGTERGKGILPIFSPTEYNELLLLEDPTGPDESAACGGNGKALGTYIVNGGKCSTVMEFNPSFNWIRAVAGFSAGGGTSGAGSTRSNFQEDEKTKDQEKDHGSTAGLQQQVTISQQAWDAYGPKNAYTETMRSQQAHSQASRLTDINIDAIEADLRILGDPREQFCQTMGGNSISIVAVNPFRITGGSNGSCGDWLAQPGCNEILSNKNWMVFGVNHSIKEGSYTTTLKLKLADPGTNLRKKSPLGGDGSGGATVKNTCP